MHKNYSYQAQLLTIVLTVVMLQHNLLPKSTKGKYQQVEFTIFKFRNQNAKIGRWMSTEQHCIGSFIYSYLSI